MTRDPPILIDGDDKQLRSIDGDDKQPRSAPFPIVGIGASAGGLEAFNQLLAGLPPDTGMAFVLVQHLAPDHPSLLTDILSRSTAMPVLQAEDGTRIAANHVYVIPPNTCLRIDRGLLRLTVRGTAGLHLPIDHLFRSLAVEQRRLAIGVVLSGTGSDGSQGIRAIKEECGIVLAQDEISAQYAGMPRTAVETGAVDFVLPPLEIGRQLAILSRNVFVVAPSEAGTTEVLPSGDGELRRIFLLLERVTRVDFTLYKQSTIRRRIGRRMIVRKCASLAEYLTYVQHQPDELRELYKDILISVTSFFRDPASFDALAQQLTPLVRDAGTGSSLRVWVPGCATGEEVYSIAILLREIIEREGIQSRVQLFGTDLSESALEQARSGVYPERIAENVSAERLHAFFHRVERGYQITKALRDTCLFAKQDVSRDPPFSRTDLVSCRNLLIYLGQTLQRSVFPVFHYSLKPQGLLFLGSAETLVDSADLFQAVDTANKIFSRKPGPTRVGSPFPLTIHPVESVMLSVPRSRQLNGADLQKRADRAIQNRYAPDGVLVNAEMQILQFRGQTGFYLEPAPGAATHDLLRMAHASLQPALKRLVASAIEQNTAVQQHGLRIEHRGEVRDINLEIIPINGDAPRERYYLIVFDPVRTSAPSSFVLPASDSIQESEAEENKRLKRELAEVRDYLRAQIQDHEAALEELRAANEEISSANEELQSANEQLATAKEELQSTNEELTTVNDELNGRNSELALLSNDLTNVLSSVDVPILMVDRGLRLRRYTPSAARHFGLTADHIGQCFGDLEHQLPCAGLHQLAEGVVGQLAAATRDVQDAHGCWWTLTVRPYRTGDHRIEGAVLTFADVDLLHRSLATAQEERDFSNAIVNTVREPLLVLTPEFRVERGNPAFYRTFQEAADDVEGRPLHELGNGEWNLPQLRHMLEEVLPHNFEFSDLEVEQTFRHIGARSMSLNGRRIVRKNGSAQAILLAIEDMTARHQAEQSLLRSNTELQRFAYVVSHDLQAPLRSIGSFTELIRRRYRAQLDTEADELMQFVLDGVHRMNCLIRDLLAYSRAGESEAASRKPVSVKDALQEALWNLQAASAECGATVTQDELPTILYNPRQLTQVFQNLIGNALKYRREVEPPRVYISVHRRVTDWVFSVRDNGIGFDAEQGEGIFQVFKRLHGQDIEGTGIGLAICKRVVENHGGRIWAESEPGVGSRFHFTVPIDPTSSKG